MFTRSAVCCRDSATLRQTEIVQEAQRAKGFDILLTASERDEILLHQHIQRERQRENKVGFCWVMWLLCQKTHTKHSKKESRMNGTKPSDWSYTHTWESCRKSQSHKFNTSLRVRRNLWPQLDDHLIVAFFIILNNTQFPKFFSAKATVNTPHRVSPSGDSHLVSQQFNRQCEHEWQLKTTKSLRVISSQWSILNFDASKSLTHEQPEIRLRGWQTRRCILLLDVIFVLLLETGSQIALHRNYRG